MAKNDFLAVLKGLMDQNKEFQVALPAFGVCKARVKSLRADVVELELSEPPRTVFAHYTSVIVLT